MTLIETVVTETTVRMRYADNADASKAMNWIDFQVPIDKLTLLLKWNLVIRNSNFLRKSGKRPFGTREM